MQVQFAQIIHWHILVRLKHPPSSPIDSESDSDTNPGRLGPGSAAGNVSCSLSLTITASKPGHGPGRRNQRLFA